MYKNIIQSKNTAISIILSFSACLISLFLLVDFAHAQTININPALVNHNQGESFSVDVNIDTATSVYSVNFDFVYDPTKITYTGASEGSFISSGCASSPPSWALFAENPSGNIVSSITQVGACSGSLGQGTVATFNFTAKNVNSISTINFQDYSLGRRVNGNIEFISGDYWGNSTVAIGDTIPPSITILGDNPFYLEAGVSFVDPGATSSDNIDGDITAGINTVSNLNESAIGSYEIDYVSTDSSGNTATATRSVIVQDTIPPSITILGDNPFYLEAGVSFVDPGATSSDSFEGDITNSIATSTNLDISNINSYFFTYSVSDSSGNSSNATRTIEVIDTISPSITSVSSSTTANSAAINFNISEDATSTIYYGLSEDYGYSANNNIASSTFSFNIEDLVPSSVYHFKIVVADLGGNSSTSVDYTLNTLESSDITPPIISNPLPSGSLNHGTNKTTISVETDENSFCYFSNSQSFDILSGEIFSNTGLTSHSTQILGLKDGTNYTYYVKCRDYYYNSTPNSNITFSVSNAPSSGGGGGGGGGSRPQTDNTPPSQPTNMSLTRLEKSIEIVWTNPTNSDFDKILLARTTELLDSFISAEAARGIGDTIAEGDVESALDASISTSQTYYYYLFSADTAGNYSKAVILSSASPSSDKNSEAPENSQAEIPDTQTSSDFNYDDIENLGRLQSSLVEQASKIEADLVLSKNSFIELDKLHADIYNKIVRGRYTEMDALNKYSIAYFIRFGTKTTLKLGAGERAGVLSSYENVFSKLPANIEEWKDVIKIGNGRWPTQRNIEAEKNAELTKFSKVYKREANMDQPNDNAAVTVMTYGLRPAIRNLDSEKIAIITFKHIYGHNPQSAGDWDTARAIAYSGATR